MKLNVYIASCVIKFIGSMVPNPQSDAVTTLIEVYKFFFIITYFYCYVGWGLIVAFIKVLTIYQIYHI
jgi:hypothetical protein